MTSVFLKFHRTDPAAVLCLRFWLELFKNYNSLGIRFGNLWFQQYESYNKHDWHIHGLCHFTNVYFLELEDPEIKTEIKDLYGTVINYSAKEGDILSFPSFLYHRSPTNNSKKRKTQYKNGLYRYG